MAAADAAAAQVALKYDPQQAAIQRQIDAARGQTAANEAGLQTYGTTGRQAIGNVYDTLGSLLTGNRAQSAADLGQQADLVGQGYTQANNYQNSVADQARTRLSALSDQLGAGQAGNFTVQSDLEKTLGGILGQNAQAQAATTGNLRTWAGQWDQILGNGINIGEQTRAKTAGDFETELLKLLGDNKVAGLEGENAMQGKLADILGARQNDLVATYNQLAQQEWERSLQQAQMDMEAQKSNASLALQSRGLDLQAQGQADDAAYKQASLSKGDSLSPKDLLAAMMQQEGMKADQAQQGFANNMSQKQYELDQLKTMAGLQGDQTNGNDMLAAYISKPDAIVTPQQLNTYASQLAQLGYPNNVADYLAQLAAQNAQKQAASHATSNGGSNSIGGSGGGGFSFNPARWGSNFVQGMSNMTRFGSG